MIFRQKIVLFYSFARALAREVRRESVFDRIIGVGEWNHSLNLHIYLKSRKYETCDEPLFLLAVAFFRCAVAACSLCEFR